MWCTIFHATALSAGFEVALTGRPDRPPTELNRAVQVHVVAQGAWRLVAEVSEGFRALGPANHRLPVDRLAWRLGEPRGGWRTFSPGQPTELYASGEGTGSAGRLLAVDYRFQPTWDDPPNAGGYVAQVAYRVEGDGTLVLSAVQPQPFRPGGAEQLEVGFHVPAPSPGSVTLRIITDEGVAIHESVEAVSESGWNRLHWDGRLGGGDYAHSGSYQYEVMADGGALLAAGVLDVVSPLPQAFALAASPPGGRAGLGVFVSLQPEAAGIGRAVLAEVRVTNTGTEALYGAQVSVHLPFGLVPWAGADFEKEPIGLTLGAIGPGETAVRRIALQVLPQARPGDVEVRVWAQRTSGEGLRASAAQRFLPQSDEWTRGTGLMWDGRLAQATQLPAGWQLRYDRPPQILNVRPGGIYAVAQDTRRIAAGPKGPLLGELWGRFRAERTPRGWDADWDMGGGAKASVDTGELGHLQASWSSEPMDAVVWEWSGRPSAKGQLAFGLHMEPGRTSHPFALWEVAEAGTGARMAAALAPSGRLSAGLNLWTSPVPERTIRIFLPFDPAAEDPAIFWTESRLLGGHTFDLRGSLRPAALGIQRPISFTGGWRGRPSAAGIPLASVTVGEGGMAWAAGWRVHRGGGQTDIWIRNDAAGAGRGGLGFSATARSSGGTLLHLSLDGRQGALHLAHGPTPRDGSGNAVLLEVQHAPTSGSVSVMWQAERFGSFRLSLATERAELEQVRTSRLDWVAPEGDSQRWGGFAGLRRVRLRDSALAPGVGSTSYVGAWAERALVGPLWLGAGVAHWNVQDSFEYDLYARYELAPNLWLQAGYREMPGAVSLLGGSEQAAPGLYIRVAGVFRLLW